MSGKNSIKLILKVAGALVLMVGMPIIINIIYSSKTPLFLQSGMVLMF